MRTFNRLKAQTLRALPAGKHPDGLGLWLVKTAPDTGRWILRVHIGEKRREMGLGSMNEVTLGRARELAREARGRARAGGDPVGERRELRAAHRKAPQTLEEVIWRALEARKPTLKNERCYVAWVSPLKVHVIPTLGQRSISELDQNIVAEAFRPIWQTKAETARKAMNRLGLALDYAEAMNLPVERNIVKNAKILLGKQVHEATHVPAMHWKEIPTFYAELEKTFSAGSIALRMLILTGARPGEVRGMRFDEIDGAIWTLHADRMKKGRPFRVPLAEPALRLVEQVRPFSRDGYLFAGATGSPTISEMTLTKLMIDRKMEARPHGFRSTFRTWLAEVVKARPEVAEHAISHVTGSQTERAYLRTDYLEERIPLMARWAAHVTGEKPGAVITLPRLGDAASRG